MSQPPPIPPLAKKIVVEPLSDERLTRIERAVVSRVADAAPARAPRRWIGLAAAVAATALAAGVIGWLAHSRAAGPGAPPAVAATLPIAVHTDAQASTLDIGDATIASSAATAFVITRPDGGVLVDLARGRVELEVGKRGARPPLVVRAGDTDVIVVGTHFTVDYGDGHGEVDVRVREGRVRIVRQAHEVFVASGHAWSSRAGAVVAMDELGSAAPGAGSGAVIGDTAPTGSAGFQVAVGPGPAVLHDRVAVVPDAHKPVTIVHHAEPTAGSDAVIGKHGEVMSPGAKVMLDAATDPRSAARAAIRDVPLPPPVDVHTTDADAQVRAYSEAAFGKPGEATGPAYGDDASHALYSLALVQETRLQRTDLALTTIDAYLRRFAHGPDRASVLWLQVRIHCLDRRWDATCHAAAQSYLDKAPNGPGAHVAELITYTE